MGNRKAEILDEISHLLEQYRQEVPSRRRPWPESIKRRALELSELGLNYTQIAERTGLPYYTLLKWKGEKKTPSFTTMNVVATRAAVATVTETTPVTTAGEVATVAETTPVTTDSTVALVLRGGLRIEGVDFEFLMKLLPVLQADAR